MSTKRSRSAITAAVIGLSAALQVRSTGVEATYSSDPQLQGAAPITEERLQIAIRTREGVGFPAGRDYVHQLFLERQHTLSASAYNFPLTEDEEQEMAVRSAMVEDVTAIRRHFSTANPGAYGGAYVDHRAGGRLVVLSVDLQEINEQAVRPLTRYPERLDVRPASYTERLLRDAVDALASGYGEMYARGAIPPVDLGSETERNAVLVVTRSAEAVPIVQASFADILENAGLIEAIPALVFIVGDGGQEDVVVWGGDRLDDPNQAPQCSAGIQMSIDLYFGTVGATTTAGHCPSVDYTHASPFPHGDPLVYVAQTADISNSDAQFHWVFGHNNYGGIWDSSLGVLLRVTGEAPIFGLYDEPGAMVCRHGFASTSSCAGIISTNWMYTAPWPSTRVTHNLRTTTYSRAKGDSGGAVNGFVLYSLDVPAVGLHLGNTGHPLHYSMYSFIANVRWDLAAAGHPGLYVRPHWQ